MFLVVAIFFHLPGIKLFYNIKIENYPVIKNIVAIIFTLIICQISYLYLDSINAVILIFTLCHILWGVFFASYLKKENSYFNEKN